MMITIRPFETNDLAAVLALIERSDSTNRTEETWRKNGMTAILAFDGKRLVGAIPLMPRSLSLGREETMNVLWISAAHVEPEYRNRGIGTEMDRGIERYFAPDYKGVFAYRADRACPAYRWYLKIGYEELIAIDFLKKPAHGASPDIAYRLIENHKDIGPWEDRIYRLFNAHTARCGGFPRRTPDFWSNIFTAHYYKEAYDYAMLLLTTNDDLLAYAFLGRTDMRDGVDRLDVLEMIAPEVSGLEDRLIDATCAFAATRRIDEVRAAAVANDKHNRLLRAKGFTGHRQLYILGKLFGEEPGAVTEHISEVLHTQWWRYFHIDYI